MLGSLCSSHFFCYFTYDSHISSVRHQVLYVPTETAPTAMSKSSLQMKSNNVLFSPRKVPYAKSSLTFSPLFNWPVCQPKDKLDCSSSLEAAWRETNILNIQQHGQRGQRQASLCTVCRHWSAPIATHLNFTLPQRSRSGYNPRFTQEHRAEPVLAHRHAARRWPGWIRTQASAAPSELLGALPHSCQQVGFLIVRLLCGYPAGYMY